MSDADVPDAAPLPTAPAAGATNSSAQSQLSMRAPAVFVCNSCGERYETSDVADCTLCECAHFCSGFLRFELTRTQHNTYRNSQ